MKRWSFTKSIVDWFNDIPLTWHICLFVASLYFRKMKYLSFKECRRFVSYINMEWSMLVGVWYLEKHYCSSWRRLLYAVCTDGLLDISSVHLAATIHLCCTVTSFINYKNSMYVGSVLIVAWRRVNSWR